MENHDANEIYGMRELYEIQALIMDALLDSIDTSREALIGDELQKYHEDRIRRDLGEDTKPRPGMDTLDATRAKPKKKLPHGLVMQWFQLN